MSHATPGPRTPPTYSTWSHPPDDPSAAITHMPPPPPPPGDGPPSPTDKTELALLVLSDEDFKAKMDQEAGVGRPSEREERLSDEPVLLPRPKSIEEEQALFTRVMASLRERVVTLEKEDDRHFDPDWPVADDRDGYVDDPLLRLSGNIGQDAMLRSAGARTMNDARLRTASDLESLETGR